MPSKCCDDGPVGRPFLSRRFRFPAIGSYGAITEAKIAITTNAATRTKPTIAAGFRRNRDHASDHSPPVGVSSWISRLSSSTSDTSAQPDPWVDGGVRAVHDQVDDHEDDCEE